MAESGYLLVLVGRSERRPHRSEAPGDRYYFKRVGDSFYSMEHYDIEDMFNRLAPAKLELSWSYRVEGRIDRGHGDQEIQGVFFIALCNSSRVTARYPYIRVLTLSRYSIWEFGIDGNGNFGLPHRISGQRTQTLFSGGADDVIHPGQELVVFGIEVRRHDLGKGVVEYSGKPVPVPIQMRYQVGCENSQMLEDEMTISSDEILAKMASL